MVSDEETWFLFVCLLFFYVLSTFKVISGQVPTCDSSHSWWLYSAASLEHQATGTMTCYPTQSRYPDTEPTSPCHVLIMPSARLRSDKYTFLSHCFDSTGNSIPCTRCTHSTPSVNAPTGNAHIERKHFRVTSHFTSCPPSAGRFHTFPQLAACMLGVWRQTCLAGQ